MQSLCPFAVVVHVNGRRMARCAAMVSGNGASPKATAVPRLRGFADRLLSIGAYAGEPEPQRARRRIMVAALWIATLLTIPTIGSDFSAGYTWSAVGNACVIVVTVGVLMALHLRPRWFAVLTTFVLATVFVVQLVQTALFGGLFGSSERRGVIPVKGKGEMETYLLVSRGTNA